LRLSWLLALSHLRRRRTQNLISIVGVAIGVMVLTTALSLTNGFSGALIEATLRATPHLTLQSWDFIQPDSQPDPKIEKTLDQTPAITAWGRFNRTQVVIARRAGVGKDGKARGAQYQGSNVVGVQPEREAKVLDLSGETREQLRTLPPAGILLGSILARNLGALPGDQVVLVTANIDDLNEVKRKLLTVYGIFRSGNAVVDGVLSFVQLDTLAELRGVPGKIQGYHARLRQPNAAGAMARSLNAGGGRFWAEAWQDGNRQLVEQVELTKRLIGVMLLLIVIVASFGIVNVLSLIVFEKTAEIAILRAMGARSGTILGIFLLEGAVLGFLGVLLGNILGLGLSGYFTIYPISIPGSLYFITQLPAQMQWFDFVWVSAASFAMTVVAALIPARRAAAILPARVIR
jgi:lipoprotein-releasing system permease protein